MKEKKLFVRADTFVVKIVTEHNEVIDFIKSSVDEFTRLTINFQVIDESILPDITLIYKNNRNYNIDFNEVEKEVLFECPWNLIDKSTILPMIFRYIVEKLRQEKSEIKVHASAVEKDGKTILFMAPSEGGKTTTAMAMCQKYGCSLKANDAAVIKFKEEIPMMLRGDTIFKVRLNGLEAYSKEMYTEKVSNVQAKGDMPWFDKLKINAEEIGISLDNKESPVKYIFFIKLDPLISGCAIKKYNENLFERKEQWFKPKMQILQNITGTIRGSDLIPIGNDGTLIPIEIPSVDTKNLYIQRINFVNELFEKCEVYQLRGQLEDITEFINNTISK